MKLNVNIMTIMGAVLLGGLSVGFPVAKLSDTTTEEKMQLQPLPISMSLAVRAAEAVAPGQAIAAGLEVAEGRPMYEIHMLSTDNRLNIVQVDARDGNVAVMSLEEQEQLDKEEIVPPDEDERNEIQISTYTYRSHRAESCNSPVHACGRSKI